MSNEKTATYDDGYYQRFKQTDKYLDTIAYLYLRIYFGCLKRETLKEKRHINDE